MKAPPHTSAAVTTDVKVELMTVPKVAERLTVGRTKVYELLNRGELESLWIDSCRRVITSSVEAYLVRKRTEARNG